MKKYTAPYNETIQNFGGHVFEKRHIKRPEYLPYVHSDISLVYSA